MLHTVHLQPGCYISQAPQTSCTHLEGMLWLCKSLSHQNVVYCIYSWKHHIPLVHHNCAKSKASWASRIYATAIDTKFIRCQRELNGPTLWFLRGLFPTPDKHKLYGERCWCLWNLVVLMQRDYACYVQARQVQVRLRLCHSLCVHVNHTLSRCCVLGLWWLASQACQCTVIAPPDACPGCCCSSHAHSSGQSYTILT